ncbi:MAG TPA: antibiotic biosynthesis monooxygenase family protein [Terriglobales bacterium]|nr:antibiotic biosynthesis monooxygenase family protein [Terriglobales bacterium]
MPQYLRLHEFLVKPGCEAEFERIYGSAGDWVKLFREAEGYEGTELLLDSARPRRYVTIDRWTSESAYNAFQSQFGKRYTSLDLACERLNELEKALGGFISGDSG